MQTLYKQGFLGKVQKSDSRDESLLIFDGVFKLLCVWSMLGVGEDCLLVHAHLVLHSSTQTREGSNPSDIELQTLPGMKLQEACIVYNPRVEYSTQSLEVKLKNPTCCPQAG